MKCCANGGVYIPIIYIKLKTTTIYMGIEVEYVFQADGISNMKINKGSKDYNIHLIISILLNQ